MKNYKKKIGFTFALSLICLPNGFAISRSNDNSSGPESSSGSFDSRPDFLKDNSRSNDPTSFDSRNGTANDNTQSNSQANSTPASTPTPSTGPNVAPRRPKQG